MSGLNTDDIIRMAREAGWEKARAFDDCLACGVFDVERFANLVAAAEREACAKVCESAGPGAGPVYCAFAIRAKGNDAT